MIRDIDEVDIDSVADTDGFRVILTKCELPESRLVEFSSTLHAAK